MITSNELPLTLSQHEIWLEQRIWPKSPHLNIGGWGILMGKIDKNILLDSLKILRIETDALRSIIKNNEKQILIDEENKKIDFIDIEKNKDFHTEIKVWFQEKFNIPFDFSHATPWQCSLLSQGDKLHALTFHCHHLLMDGASISLLMERFAEIYNQIILNNKTLSLTNSCIHDDIDQSKKYLLSKKYQTDKNYWKSRISTLPPSLIPSALKEYTHHLKVLPYAHQIHDELDNLTYRKILEISEQEKTSIFSIFLLTLSIYLAKTKQRRDIWIGVPVLKRSKENKKSIGMFSGICPIRITIDPNESIKNTLKQIRFEIRLMLRHSNYPHSHLRQDLALNSEQRIFDVVLSFENFIYPKNFGEAIVSSSRQFFGNSARFPLVWTVSKYSNNTSIEMIVSGNSNLFSESDITLLERRLLYLLKSVLANTNAIINTLSVMPGEERLALIEGIHEQTAMRDGTPSFIEQFNHRSILQSHDIALLWESEKLTYKQLHGKVISLARKLKIEGVSRNDLVALAFNRSPELIISILACARLCASFLPLDPETAVNRNKAIIKESGSKLLLTAEIYKSSLSNLDIPVISISQEQLEENNQFFEEPWPNNDDIAYVMYTSGSSGTPKGVKVNHGALSRRLAWIAKAFNITPSDRSGHISRHTFDPALIELLMPLTMGASVALAPAGLLSAEQLGRFAIEQQITFMAFVPVTLQRFLAGIKKTSPLKLRIACCGGEVLSAELANNFLQITGAQLFNVYGPTESVIFATAWLCQPNNEGRPLPLGSAIDNTRIYVLDESGDPMPFGETGEIFVGGNAIASGYINENENNRFRNDPFVSSGRMYQTGDYGYLTTDGNLYFTGRKDRQIKINGCRIEPEEIEKNLTEIPGIKEAAVKVINNGGRQQLMAWVACIEKQPNEIKGILRKKLPDYMLPSIILTLEQLPHTAHGKIDFNELPIPKQNFLINQGAQSRSNLEEEIRLLWETVLRQSPIQITDNFFVLGGDSLAAIDILSGMEKICGHPLPMFLLSENPTIESLSTAIRSENNQGKLLWPLSQNKHGIPIYLAASGHGDLIRFQRLAEKLGHKFSVYMLQPPRQANFSDIHELSRRYTSEIIGTGQQHAYIGGFSTGGIAALECARTLQQYKSVSGLILLDSPYPIRLIYPHKMWKLLAKLASKFNVKKLPSLAHRVHMMFTDKGLENQIEALSNYAPKKYAGRTLLVRSSAFVWLKFWLFSPWKNLIHGELNELTANGFHGEIFSEKNIDELATHIKNFIQKTSHSENI